MKWLLILHFAWPGGEQSRPAGMMLDEATCVVAGRAMSAWLEMTNPGLSMTWDCSVQVAA